MIYIIILGWPSYTDREKQTEEDKTVEKVAVKQRQRETVRWSVCVCVLFLGGGIFPEHVACAEELCVRAHTHAHVRATDRLL